MNKILIEQECQLFVWEDKKEDKKLGRWEGGNSGSRPSANSGEAKSRKKR